MIMNISFQSIQLRNFDFVFRPCVWTTSLQHVWILATSGEGLYYRQGEKKPLEISARGESLYYLPPGFYRFVNANKQKTLHLITLHFLAYNEFRRDFFAPYLLPTRFLPNQRKRLARFMTGIHRVSEQKNTFESVEFRRHLIGFVGAILEWSQCKPVSQLPRQPRRSQNAITYLQKHYMEELNIDFLARLCNVSRPHFFRIFKEDTGITAQNYLCQQRLEHAKNLLLLTQKSISEICYEVGWNDAFHFSRIFCREIGCSPTRYRKNGGI